jgi:arylsulfatase A-like enzyme/Flp pilus assembly protein TadD
VWGRRCPGSSVESRFSRRAELARKRQATEARVAGAALGLIALAWTGISCGRVRRDSDQNVLLVSIDTLRADALGAYGNKTVETPWIDRLASEGVRFEVAHAHNVITLPSHANLLSGQLPLGHGVRDNSGFRFPAGGATLATRLRALGYRTGAFVSAFPLDSRFGLDAGFDVYDDRLGGAEIQGDRAFEVPERSGAKTVAAALQWMGEQRGRKVFCFVHLYEPHFPYEPPPPFAARFAADPYQGEVSAADAALEPLLRPLLEAGVNSRTLVVLTADHGEGLGEHGELTHGVFAYEATLRVPLILHAPRILGPRVVRTEVRHVDVLPTVFDALGLEVPKELPGRSLLALAATGSGEAPPSYFEALSSSLNQGWAPLRGARRDGLKYVDLPLPELYDLRVDAREEKNLAATHPAELESMRALLSRYRAEDRGIERRQEDPATLERLRALGYLAGGTAAPKERYTEEDDPKRLIEVDRRNREVLRLFREGRIQEAAALCRENIRRRPNMPLAYLHLAFLERALGHLDLAVEAARKAFELKPLHAEHVSLLAVYLTEAGRPKEAADLLEPYMTAVAPDVDVLSARGVALAALGRREEALDSFARAREIDPTNPMVLVNIGTVLLQEGHRADARRAFEAALDIDQGVARAHNSLGVIAAFEGKTEEALARWKRAVELNPTDYQTLFNLGFTLKKQGREAEARAHFEEYLKHAPPALERRDIARVRGWLGRG